MADSPPRKRARAQSPSHFTPAATTPAHAGPIPSTSKLAKSPPPAPLLPESTLLATLKIKLPSVYLQGAPTAFQLPQHLASFSYSPTRELLTGARRDEAMAEYQEPELGVDLNQGFEDCCWRDGSVDEGLDALVDSYVSRTDHTGLSLTLSSIQTGILGGR